MAANRKEYELLMKLQAALGSNFNSTFQTAMNTTNSLQNKLQDLKKSQNDISAYQKTEASIKSLKEEKERLESATDRNEAAIDKVNKKLATEEERLSTISDRLKAAGIDTNNLAGENDRLENSYNNLKKAQEDYARASEAVEKNRQAISATRTELLTTVGVATAGAAALWKGFIQPAANFEAQMSVVEAISGATADDMEQLTELAKRMGETTKFTAIESGQALEYMAMAGWDTTAMMSGLPGVMNLAAASGENLALVSDIVTDAMTAFGMGAEESARFADVLAATATSSNTNVGIMGETFKHVAPLAGAMGYSIEDMSVAIGMMANAGVKGTRSGTSLKNIITNLAKPSDDVVAAMDALNISLVNTDGTTKSFEEVVNSLRIGFDGLTEAEKAAYAATIGGKQGMAGLLAIVNSGEEDFQILTEAINNCAGAAEEMALTRLDNLGGDMTLAKSAWDALRMSIGELFLPKLREATQGLTDIIYKVTEFVSENKELITTVAKVAAGLLAAKTAFLLTKLAVLGVQGVYLSLIAAKASYNIALAAANIAGKKLTITQWLLNKAMLANPAGLIAAGIMAIVVVGYLLIKNWEKVKEVAGKVWGWINEKLTSASDAINDALMSVCEAIKVWGKNVWDSITGALSNIAEWFTEKFTAAQEAINAAFATVGEFFTGVWNSITAAFFNVVGWFFGIFTRAWGGIKTVFAPVGEYFTGIMTVVKGIFTGDTELIRAGFSQAWSGVKQVWGKAANFFGGIATKIIDKFVPAHIQEKFSEMWSSVSGIWDGAGEYFTGIMTAVKGIFTGDWDAISAGAIQAWEGVQQAWGAALGFFDGVIGSLVGLFGGDWEAIKETFGAALDSVKEIWGNVGDYFKNTVWGGIQNAFTNVAGFFKDIFGGAWQAVKSAFTDGGEIFGGITEGILAAFKGIVNSLIGGINKVVSIPFEGINSALSGIRDISILGKAPFSFLPTIGVQQIPLLEKGSNYTPDTFIAGDVGGKGGELVTNARGYQVFTAPQTSEILDNISRMMAINSTLPPVSDSDTLKTATAARAGGDSFTIEYSPTIYINGETTGNLEEKLRQNNENLLQMFAEFLRKQQEDAGRMAYA